MPPDDPLLTLPNVIVTPHIASASVATRSRMAMLAAENLVQALERQLPKHAVNREIAREWRARVRERKQASADSKATLLDNYREVQDCIVFHDC